MWGSAWLDRQLDGEGVLAFFVPFKGEGELSVEGGEFSGSSGFMRIEAALCVFFIA